MKRILVPFDGSAAARRALEHAARHAAPQPSTWLHLLNVQLPLVAPDLLARDATRAIDDELQRQGLAVLAEAEARAAALCVPCELEVRIGQPADEIVAAAHDSGCHEIVLGVADAPRAPPVSLQGLRERAPVPLTLVH